MNPPGLLLAGADASQPLGLRQKEDSIFTPQ